jgi:phosphoserine phosphatase
VESGKWKDSKVGRRFANFAFVLLLVGVFVSGCASSPDVQEVQPDPLPLWNDGEAKEQIIGFVNEISDFFSDSLVPPEKRIAVFDNDGTLWPEKPLYFPLEFIFHLTEEMAEDHPEWKTEDPFRSVLEGDYAALTAEDFPALIEATHGGMTQKEFSRLARRWLSTAEHPRFEEKYKKLAYTPMLQMLGYLSKNGFRIFICSGGTVEFIRAYSDVAYGIPPERVIGTTIDTRFEITEKGPVLYRTGAIVPPLNDREGKPVNIQRYIGLRPTIAFGNSDGDIEMLQYTAGGKGPGLAVLLHHDDAEREYSYDKDTEKALELARENGWTVVSMKNDFKAVFPEKEEEQVEPGDQ